MSERNDNHKSTGGLDGVSFFGLTDNSGDTTSSGGNPVNRSENGVGSSDNRSESGGGRSDDGSGKSDDSAGNGLPISSAGSVSEDRSNSGNDSVKSGNRGSRGRGRPRTGTGNGVSGERRTIDGNESTGNGSQAEAKIVVASGETDIKPKVGGFTAAPTKFKKGYRPLMDEKESIQTVGGMFAMTGLALGSHWELSDNEEKELGKALARVLDKFPVKVGENPELLEKIFAIQGLAVTAALVIIPRMRETAMRGKNDGIYGKVARRQSASGGNGQQAESNRNTVTNNGTSEVSVIDEYDGAFRPAD